MSPLGITFKKMNRKDIQKSIRHLKLSQSSCVDVCLPHALYLSTHCYSIVVLQPIYPVHHIYKQIITWLYFNIYITWNIYIKKKLILNNDCATTSLGWYVTSSSTATALITQCRHQTCPYSLASVTDNWYWWKLHGIWDHLGDKPVDTHGRDYLS